MGKQLFSPGEKNKALDRVDGRLKVTGAAKYSAEYQIPGLTYGVLVTSTITKGRIKNIETKAAERAPGVLAVISHVNSIKVPGFADNEHPTEPPTGGRPLRAFHNDRVYFNGQPVAIVVANSFERATYAASLVKLQYDKEEHTTDFEANTGKAVLPAQAKKNTDNPLNDYNRGEADAYKTAAVKIEAEYVQPAEMHNPMELQSIIALWEAGDKLTIYDKVQGTKPTQNAFAKEWKIPLENVKVISKFVGGAFGNGLHNWPHESAAIIAAKQVKRPVKVVITREQMFTMVGYRPRTWQKIGIGATPDGKLVGITHEAIGQTSSYEEFTESTLQQTRMMYAAPNVSTRYRILPLDVSTPIWMRGPGEATGAFALESAVDELAHALHLDPIEFRLKNYTETDPEKNLPWSTKFLKECFTTGAEKIGWSKRKMEPGTVKAGEWLVGYGMGVGTFGAHRGTAAVRAKLSADGNLLMQCAVTDIGPGTGTAMVQVAATALGMAPEKITFDLGNSDYPMAGNQGGSSTVNTVGSAVQAACKALKQKLKDLATKKEAAFGTADADNIIIKDGKLSLTDNSSVSIAISDLFKQNNLPEIEVTEESKPGEEANKYSKYSFSIHFAEVHVHPKTGQIRVKKVVTCADAGTIISWKTAANQMIGGVTGGIGMALTEDAVMDHRYGRYVTKDLADYHVPVHADVPPIDVWFVNKPDYIVDPIGTKGLGEIAIIGVAPAIANAIFNATGKRIREVPITPDKIII
ncbi:xanthine dehydrogenase family protein molybdopterin-binding subunit [Segetibacter koreensis]|uniref:xanthine dehydrogenase family protein molybdopterin-binding subunit n=1 Tax=Segetibacter koreensis TaxID=398037 RepID=UPI000362CF7A|nr:xanthine dehydrogenase family protein molybdopterin-binding subunit [Segetibacter koreensis]